MQTFKGEKEINTVESERPSLEDAHAVSLAEAEGLLTQLASVFFPSDSTPLQSDGDSIEERESETGQAAESHSLEAGYRTLVEQIHAVVFMAYLDKGIGDAYVSPQIEAMLGFTQEEWLNDPVLWYRQVHPEDKERWSIEAAQMFLSGEPLNSVYRVMARDGRVVWFQCEAKMVRREDGQPWFIHGVGFNITALKQAEAERDAERRLLNALIEQLPVGVLFRDLPGRLTQANQKVCDILGIEGEELTGMMAEDVLRKVRAKKPDGTPLADEEAPSSVALRTQNLISPVELLITTPAGNARHLSITAAPVALAGEESVGVVTVVNDISEQHALQEQLRQSQKMESIGTLAGGVAHDFNNLLTVILGNTQLALRKLQSDDPLQSRLAEIEKAGHRASVLTRQLLAFSRRQHLVQKVINLAETIADVMKMLQRIIGEDIEVDMRAGAHLWTVFADPGQIEQVVMNLAINARDAMPGGGRLVIETHNVTLDESYHRQHGYSKPGKYVRLTVSDTGYGMDAATRERIFEPFFTTKEVGKGTGLGLAMVYGIVKQHEGFIEVYSEVGHGTIFKIYLPVDEQAVADETPEVQPTLRGGNETILVAEDEDALRELARDVLEGLGYTVLLAKDGAEAVEMFTAHRERIEMVILDMVMPRLGGHEAYERMRAAGGDVPMIFMTGYSPEIVQSKYADRNMTIENLSAVLIQKPYSVEALGRKVRETLDAKRK